MTFEQYLLAAENYAAQNPCLRRGQAYMNFLCEVNNDMYHSIPWDIDPYYQDKFLGVFLSWVGDRWGVSLCGEEDKR